jgi:hypothetical protein
MLSGEKSEYYQSRADEDMDKYLISLIPEKY